MVIECALISKSSLADRNLYWGVVPIDSKSRKWIKSVQELIVDSDPSSFATTFSAQWQEIPRM